MWQRAEILSLRAGSAALISLSFSCASSTSHGAKTEAPPNTSVEDSELSEKEFLGGSIRRELSAEELLSDSRQPDSTRALPELTFSHLGMHIGGESNSPKSKEPWLKAIEAGGILLRRCYRFVDAPRKGGSYGVDLYVSKNGGAPEVRASRQKIGGEEFDSCMRDAFRSLAFGAPERPTVLSYSLLFSLGKSGKAR